MTSNLLTKLMTSQSHSIQSLEPRLWFKTKQEMFASFEVLHDRLPFYFHLCFLMSSISNDYYNEIISLPYLTRILHSPQIVI